MVPDRVLEGRHLAGREVGPVGDPDRAVFEGVDGGLVGHRFGVDPAVLPHLGMVTTGGRGLGVGDGAGDVAAGQPGVGDRRRRRGGLHPRPGQHHGERGDRRHGHPDQTPDQQPASALPLLLATGRFTQGGASRARAGSLGHGYSWMRSEAVSDGASIIAATVREAGACE